MKFATLLVLTIYLGLSFLFELMKVSAKTRKGIVLIAIIQTIWIAFSFHQICNVYDQIH